MKLVYLKHVGVALIAGLLVDLCFIAIDFYFNGDGQYLELYLADLPMVFCILMLQTMLGVLVLVLFAKGQIASGETFLKEFALLGVVVVAVDILAKIFMAGLPMFMFLLMPLLVGQIFGMIISGRKNT